MKGEVKVRWEKKREMGKMRVHKVVRVEDELILSPSNTGEKQKCRGVRKSYLYELLKSRLESTEP